MKKLQSDLHELKDVISDRSLSPTLETYDSLEKTLDVFISYRRSNGSQLASLIKLILEMRNFSVFLDVDRYVIINQYVAHHIQQPIPKIQILTFHKGNQSDCF